MQDAVRQIDLPERLYTLKEAAEVYHIRYWQLQRLCKAGKIPYVVLFDRTIRVRLSDIETYIVSCQRGGAQ